MSGREDITAQEIVTLGNFVKEYNSKMGTNVKVIAMSQDGSYILSKSNEERNIDFIKYFSNVDKKESKFMLNRISYNDNTGLVETIIFRQYGI